MKSCRICFLLLFLTIFLFCEKAWSIYQLEYRIEVQADGSATWTIKHVFPKGQDGSMFRQLSNPAYFSDIFVENVKSLVNATKQKTYRTDMIVENFAMTVIPSGNYSVVKYRFCWRGFAETEDTRIKIGDVFEVAGLFLYEEGTVYIAYPLGYTIESVSPRPDAESDQTLTWYGISYFGTGEPKILLREKAASGLMETLKENALIILSLIALLGVGSISLYYFGSRRKERIGTKAPVPPNLLGIQDDEEKVVGLLEAAGGSSYQSTIADHCGFSRSKTSKLLAAMERKGKIRRKKKGREKVVTLIKEN